MSLEYALFAPRPIVRLLLLAVAHMPCAIIRANSIAITSLGNPGQQGAQSSASARPRRVCGTIEIHKQLMTSDAEYRSTQESLSLAAASRDRRLLKGDVEVARAAVSNVAVVVHVVFAEDSQNIDDHQIQSQIEILNRDFRKRDDQSTLPVAFQALAGDARIEFHLASVDPEGKPTNGVTRTKTAKTSFGDYENDIKFAEKGGTPAWPTDRYLNLWVAPKIIDPNLGELLGYAQPPGGPAATDGVVILYSAFGSGGTAQAPFDTGRTATHEIGHYFNLRHIWGDDQGSCDGTDEVSDTPNQAGSNDGCPAYPSISCNNGPDGDLFMNFMDYTYDGCMNMFTTGQCVRMQTTLFGTRRGLLWQGSGSQPSTAPASQPSAPKILFPSMNEVLQGTWVRGGDGASVITYRLANSPVPPARAHESIELRPDGGFTHRGPGVTDLGVAKVGHWFVEKGAVVLEFLDNDKRRIELPIVRLTSDSLVIRKSP